MVLITGAAGGLGRAMAMECARRGFSLFLTDRDAEGLTRIERGVSLAHGVKVFTFACDLTDGGEVEALFEAIGQTGEPPDMLCNVAGVDFEGGFLERDSARLLSIVRLNVEATLLVTHAALARRSPGGGFTIITVCSLASVCPMPLKATYAASKRFLLDFSIALGQELKHDNVRVLALCPGGMPTTESALSGIDAQGFWGRITSNSLGTIARNTIDRALAGKRVYVPGVVNRVLSAFSRIVPPVLAARLLHRRWAAAQKKWLTNA
ncbi:MAG: SDR family NAD(P)-dependent oxidoreductase [Clostridiaceae bacterium]|nr:SDR family NAD(P)-dependent oxidoreductase [Eubacteriales bacterium]